MFPDFASEVFVPAPTTEEELLTRAHALAGRTLGELAGLIGAEIPQDLSRQKGWTGVALERALGATAGSRPVPDFEELGIELKSIPVDASGRPMESTYVSLVPLTSLHLVTWESSPLRHKLSQVLWVPVEGIREKQLSTRRVGRAFIWRPSPDEARAIRTDWEELTDMIRVGDVESITGHLGAALQIRGKALDASQRVMGIGDEGHLSPTKPRGFYLRRSFTTKLIARHLLTPRG